MKVWFEASAGTINQRSGVESYVYNLGNRLSDISGGQVVNVLNSQTDCYSRKNDSFILPVPPKVYLGGLGILSKLFTSLVHYPYSIIPNVSSKAIITIYDLAYKRFPETYRKEDLEIMEGIVSNSIKKAHHIIAISQSTKNDLIEYYKKPEEMISITPLAADPIFSIDQSTPKQEGGYILAVGNIQPRKNLMSLLQAYNHIKDDIRQDLILVGKVNNNHEGRRLTDYVEENGLQDRVQITGYINQLKLRDLYCKADVFVYPSIYEGFGIPILEAMSAGAAVITTRSSSLPEAAGEAAYYATSPSVGGLSSALMAVLTNKHSRDSLRVKGFERALEFSWEKTAQNTLRVYEKVV